MIGELSRSLRITYEIHQSDLQELDEILSRVGTRTYYVTCIDHTKLTLNDVGEISRISLSHSSIIQSLRVHAGDYLRDPSAELSLAAHGPFSNVTYEVTADEETRIYLHNKLDQWLSGIRTWYSGIGKVISMLTIPLIAASLGFVLYFLFLMFVLRPSIIFTTANPLHIIDLYPIAGALVLGSFAWAGILILWGRTMEYFFPIATFAIGYGAKEFERMRTARNFVGGGLILAVVIGVVANFIYSYLTRR